MNSEIVHNYKPSNLPAFDRVVTWWREKPVAKSKTSFVVSHKVVSIENPKNKALAEKKIEKMEKELEAKL